MKIVKSSLKHAGKHRSSKGIINTYSYQRGDGKYDKLLQMYLMGNECRTEH